MPPDTGGRIRTFHLLRHLQRKSEICLVSYYDGVRDEEYESALKALFPKSIPIAVASRTENALGRGVHYLSKLANVAPYAISKYACDQVRALIAEAYATRRFDVAVCDFLSPSLNFPPELTIPSVLFQHNVEGVLWERMARHQSNPLKKVAFTLEAWKMRRYEASTIKRFHHVIAVSDEDRRVMTKLNADVDISVADTGVNVEDFRPSFASVSSTRPEIIFLGSMDWEPNVDAVEFFCREIWPRVLKEFPNALFTIVGRTPRDRVKALASASVEVTGTVPSPLEYIDRANAFVVPLRMGGGTRIKIYEAMAMAKAVISTSIGAEGLDVHDGKDILLADTPQDFAQALIRVLRSPDLARQLGESAAAQAARYDWSVIADQFASVLNEVKIRFAGGTDERVENLQART